MIVKVFLLKLNSKLSKAMNFLKVTIAVPNNNFLKYDTPLLRMGVFRAAHGIRSKKPPTLPKIFHSHPTVIKIGTVIPYLKRIQEIYKSRDRPLDFC